MDLVGRKFVVLSGKYTQAYFKLSEEVLNFRKAIENLLLMELTLGTTMEFPFHIWLIKSKLTSAIHSFSGLFVEQVKESIEKKITPEGELFIDEPLTFSMEIVSKCSYKTFFGSEVGDNEDLLKSFMTFHVDVGQ